MNLGPLCESLAKLLVVILLIDFNLITSGTIVERYPYHQTLHQYYNWISESMFVFWREWKGLGLPTPTPTPTPFWGTP